MIAIAIGIMIIATAYTAATDIGTTTYETYNMEQQLSKEDTVNTIKAATTNKPQNTTQKTQQQEELRDREEHEKQSHEHRPPTTRNHTPITITSPPRRNTAVRTPNNTMVSDGRLFEEIRRTGRVREQQRILQQARRNAEEQEHTPGH
jgi:hypothetical protein